MTFCTACGAEAEDGSFCGTCGTETGAPTGTGAAMPSPKPMQNSELPARLAESASGLAKWLQGLLGLVGVISLLTIPGQLKAIGIAQDFHNGSISEIDAAFDITEARSGGILVAGGLIPIAIFVLFIIWTHRCYRNLYVFGAKPLPKSTGWAIGGWFIPVYFAIGPKGIIDNIWRGSAPEPIDPLWTKRPREQWFTLGWIAYFGAMALTFVAGFGTAQDSFTEFNSGGLTLVAPLWVFQLGLVASILSMTGQFLAAYGLRNIAARYEAKRQQVSSQRS